MPRNTLSHLEFDRKEFRFSLVGDCITVFCNGRAIYHKFYDSILDARKAFLRIA